MCGKEKRVSTFDMVYKQYIESQKNNFWDAWGIVASPRTIYALRAECLENATLHKASYGKFEELFGLVIIPRSEVEDDKVYIVDEELGRTLLGQTERSE